MFKVYRHPQLEGQLVSGHDPVQACRLVNIIQPGRYLDERLFVDTGLKSLNRRMFSTPSSLYLEVQGAKPLNFNELWEKAHGIT